MTIELFCIWDRADVSPIPKQSPETGEKQSMCRVNASQDKAPAQSSEDKTDSVGKESLSSNWSFKSESKPVILSLFINSG